MKLAWLTDIHLNVIDKAARLEFYRHIVETSCDATLISGDIAEATSIESILTEMVRCLNMPIYFILGNHDYYGGQVAHVRDKMKVLSKQEANVFWLPEIGYHALSDDVILVGQDGWADGRYGDYRMSQVSLNDSRLIVEYYSK